MTAMLRKKGLLGKVSEELLALAPKGWDCSGEWVREADSA